MVFGGVLFHISFAVERNMAAGGIHAGRGCSPQSENRKRAVGDAGPYGSESGAVSKFENISKRTDISTSRAGATRGGITNNIKTTKHRKNRRCAATEQRTTARNVGAAAIRGS